ncbi:MAG TPA: hypothetical protein VGQ69_11825 [Gemmatimonadales bacterium]|jgi:hypothetical protein|nr:hypothetical protein [Gemmatimonadales bacterium]
MRPLRLYLTAIVAACPGGPAEVSRGQEFDLELDHSARIAGSEQSVHFEAVEQDSRCPVDVTCVWAGNALVRLRLQGGAGCSTLLRLNTDLEPRTGTGCGLPLEVRGLEPAPRSGEPPTGRRYRVRLLVPES